MPDDLVEDIMDTIRILNADEVRGLVTVPMAIEAVEAAYSQKHAGTGSVWPLLYHDFREGVRDMDLKSGNLDGDGIWGLKAISCYYDNPEQGLPVYHGTSLVFDYATGAPKAVLNAMPITRFRTGAAGAVGLTLADLTSGYVTSAPKTFILKLVMGAVAALVAKALSPRLREGPRGQMRLAAAAAAAALGLNVVLEPLFGYVYKAYLFGIPQDISAALAKIGAGTTLVNAVISCAITAALYPAICQALEKTEGRR